MHNENETITEENVEYWAVQVIKKYKERIMSADYWFWRLDFPLLKKKWQKTQAA